MDFQRFPKKPQKGTSLAFKMPYEVRRRVELIFHPYIKVKVGLTMVDAYFHCIEKAWALHEADKSRFLQLVLEKMDAAEGAAKGKNNVVMPESVNEKIEAVQKTLYGRDKRTTFIICVAVGVELWAEEFGERKNNIS